MPYSTGKCFAPPELRSSLGSCFYKHLVPPGLETTASYQRSTPRSSSIRYCSTPAHEMDNFNSVTVGQNRLRPLVASDYLLIELDGDSRRRQR